MHRGRFLFAAACVAALSCGLPPCGAAPENEPTVGDYVKLLASKNATVRKQAAVALGEMGTKAKEAVPALRSALRDADEEVQAAAAEALEKVSPPKKGPPAGLGVLKDLRAEAEAARREAQAQADRARAAEAKAEAVLRKLREELEQERARSAEREAAARKATERLDALLKVEAQRAADVAELRKAMQEKEARLAEATAKLAAERARAVHAEVEAKALKDRNLALVARLAELEKAINRAEKREQPPDQGAAKNTPPEDVEGLVKSVDKDSGLIKITIGSDAGLPRGWPLHVFRLDPPRYLGRVQVIEVGATESVAKRVGKSTEPIKVGDRVGTRVGPK